MAVQRQKDQPVAAMLLDRADAGNAGRVCSAQELASRDLPGPVHHAEQGGVPVLIHACEVLHGAAGAPAQAPDAENSGSCDSAGQFVRFGSSFDGDVGNLHFERTASQLFASLHGDESRRPNSSQGVYCMQSTLQRGVRRHHYLFSPEHKLV